MKQVSPELEARLAGSATTICRLWTITPLRRDPLYFTDHTEDIPYNGNVYRSTRSFQASAVEAAIGRASSNLELTILLSDGLISFHDLTRGIMDGAAATIELIDYENPSYGVMRLFRGRLNSADIPNQQIGSTTFVGAAGRISKTLNEDYTPTCRADLGDARCGVDIDAYSASYTVDSLVNERTFVASGAGGGGTDQYKLGMILWETGNNAGVAVEVLASTDAGQVVLMFPPPYEIQPGDTGTIYQGCEKTLNACDGYDNRINFRGEPYVPGMDNV